MMCVVCVLICWAVMMISSAAEQQFFPQSNKTTWEDARNHCQSCFKDLVTLTPENSQNISKRLLSDHWVGLRKNLSSTNASSMPWSRWANGDPLSFQNWYPGWPMLKSSTPKQVRYNYSCTCVIEPSLISSKMATFDFMTSSDYGNTTSNMTFNVMTSSDCSNTMSNVMRSSDCSNTTINMTRSSDYGNTTFNMTRSSDYGNTTFNMTRSSDYGNTTSNMTFNVMKSSDCGNTTWPSDCSDTKSSATSSSDRTAKCTCSPVELPEEPSTDEDYIEDLCVAMLSFGAWVEKNCTEPLPFICYDDRFFGQVSVADVDSSSAKLSWQRGPSNTEHYRLEVRGDKVINETVSNLTFDLDNLTAGACYSVQVFAVKCDRDLNPQEVAFYTIPHKVDNLTASNITATSVFLSWTKPAGYVDFYYIEVQNGMIKEKTEEVNITISSLTPGSNYTFAVLSGISGNSTLSEKSYITRFTKPGPVSKMMASNNSEKSLLLNWEKPAGSYTAFRVKAIDVNDNELFHKMVTQTSVTVTNLTAGNQITLSVTALAGTEEGEEVTITSYTTPQPVSDLTLDTTTDSLTASWTAPQNIFLTFTVELQLGGETIKMEKNLASHEKRFDKLKNAAKYTVIVFSVTNNFQSKGENSSKYTLPLPPSDVNVSSHTVNQITFQWKAPPNSATNTYSVKLSSSFWGHTFTAIVENKTSHQFKNLKSGTRYEFEVRTVVDSLLSDPATLAFSTEPVKREISLSMLCSSAETLLCDDTTTKRSVMDQLETHFDKLLGNHIFWQLEEQKSEN